MTNSPHVQVWKTKLPMSQYTSIDAYAAVGPLAFFWFTGTRDLKVVDSRTGEAAKPVPIPGTHRGDDVESLILRSSADRLIGLAGLCQKSIAFEIRGTLEGAILEEWEKSEDACATDDGFLLSLSDRLVDIADDGRPIRSVPLAKPAYVICKSDSELAMIHRDRRIIALDLARATESAPLNLDGEIAPLIPPYIQVHGVRVGTSTAFDPRSGRTLWQRDHDMRQQNPGGPGGNACDMNRRWFLPLAGNHYVLTQTRLMQRSPMNGEDLRGWDLPANLDGMRPLDDAMLLWGRGAWLFHPATEKFTPIERSGRLDYWRGMKVDTGFVFATEGCVVLGYRPS